MSVGARFAEIRERLGLSRADLAHASGYSAEQIRRVELGERMPGGELLAALLDVGGDVLYVLSGTSGIDDRFSSSSKFPTAEELHQAAMRERIRVEAKLFARLRVDRRKKVLSDDEVDLIEGYRDLSALHRQQVLHQVTSMARGEMPEPQPPKGGDRNIDNSGAAISGKQINMTGDKQTLVMGNKIKKQKVTR